MHLVITILTLFLVLSNTCIAGTFNQTMGNLNHCEYVDLRNSKCLPPGKSQSDTQFCYAFSAAEAVSFHFCQEVSPAALGLLVGQNAKSEDKIQNFWSKAGGWQDEAIKIGNEKGFCLESEFPSQVLQNDVAVGLRREYLSLLKTTAASQNSEPCNNLRSRILQVLPAAEIKDIVAYISDGQTPEGLLRLSYSRCKNPILKKVSVKTCSGEYTEKLKFIHENINNGPIPLAVADSTRPGFKVGSIENHHAVTVIGQKMESGVCKYLIRDSDKPAYRIGSITLGSGNEVDHWVTEDSLIETLKGDGTRCYSVY